MGAGPSTEDAQTSGEGRAETWGLELWPARTKAQESEGGKDKMSERDQELLGRFLWRVLEL